MRAQVGGESATVLFVTLRKDEATRFCQSQNFFFNLPLLHPLLLPATPHRPTLLSALDDRWTVEYIWLGGNDGDLRSKTRTIEGPIRSIADSKYSRAFVCFDDNDKKKETKPHDAPGGL